MRSGWRVVSEWLAPLCSCSGATTQTSEDSPPAIRSSISIPGEAMPSSLEIRIRQRARSIVPSAIGPDDLCAAHIRPQRLGDSDRAIVALIVFEDRYHRAADGEAGPVEGVHRAYPLLARGAIPRLHAARLEGAAIRTARNLAIRVLARQPDFEIICFPG